MNKSNMILANGIGDILDKRIGWRVGKGFEIVLQYDYLKMASPDDLTKSQADIIADKIYEDYNNGKIE